MKRIEAIIRPERLNAVKEALLKIGIPGMTVTHVRGFGRQRGQPDWQPEKEPTGDLLNKVKIEVAAPDDRVPAIVETIIRSAHTGQIGDGKIFIAPLENAIRIRTGETGDQAL